MRKRLNNHASAQCHVIIDKEGIHFISYTTRVISIVKKAGGKTGRMYRDVLCHHQKADWLVPERVCAGLELL